MCVLGKAKFQTDLEKMITNQKVDSFYKQNGNNDGDWRARGENWRGHIELNCTSSTNVGMVK